MLASLLVAMVLAYTAVMAALLTLRRQKMLERARTATPFAEKLQSVVDLGTQLQAMSASVQAEVELQIAAAENAKREAETAQQIAALNEEGRRAAEILVRSQIDTALKESAKSDRKFQVFVAFASFVAGIFATLGVSSLS